MFLVLVYRKYGEVGLRYETNDLTQAMLTFNAICCLAHNDIKVSREYIRVSLISPNHMQNRSQDIKYRRSFRERLYHAWKEFRVTHVERE